MWRPISSFSIKNFFSRALTQYQLFFETVSKLFARYKMRPFRRDKSRAHLLLYVKWNYNLGATGRYL